MNLRNSVSCDLKSLWTMVQREKIRLAVAYKGMIYSIDKAVSSNSVSFQPYKRHSLSTLVISYRTRMMKNYLRFCTRRCILALHLYLMEHAYNSTLSVVQQDLIPDLTILHVSLSYWKRVPLQIICAPRPSIPGTHIVSQLL